MGYEAYYTFPFLYVTFCFQEHRTSQLPLDLDTAEDDVTSLKSDNELKGEIASKASVRMHSFNCHLFCFLLTSLYYSA